MEIKVFPTDDGNRDIIVRKTRPSENPTATARDVPPEEYDATLARLVAAVRGD